MADMKHNFYNALLPELGAPDWHGKNLNALEDSIFVGDINAIEPPFEILITDTDALSPRMTGFLREVRAVFADHGHTDATIAFLPPL